MLGRELAAAGLVVVSGLARGIDGGGAPRRARRRREDASPCSAAASTATTRRGHAELARRIADGGLIVSEYAPGVEPAPWRFPARNRIIAGLALATVVVEARERSGALITADFALELGREVFAVPGEITAALSAGRTADPAGRRAAARRRRCPGRARNRARRRPAAAEVSDEARRVLALLADAPRGADELVRRR